MTVKLTLTMEDKVIAAAKEYAQAKGESLSHLVENYLKSITNREATETTFSEKIIKLKGVIDLPAECNYKEELGNLLERKKS